MFSISGNCCFRKMGKLSTVLSKVEVRLRSRPLWFRHSNREERKAPDGTGKLRSRPSRATCHAGLDPASSGKATSRFLALRASFYHCHYRESRNPGLLASTGFRQYDKERRTGSGIPWDDARLPPTQCLLRGGRPRLPPSPREVVGARGRTQTTNTKCRCSTHRFFGESPKHHTH